MKTNDPAKIKRLADFYNMIANVFWSFLNLVPISVYSYTKMNSQLFYIFLFIALLTVLLPTSFFDNIQFSKTTSLYKKLGIRFINRFTQNGYIINGLIRRKYPGYKVVSSGNPSVNKLLQQTYMFEKFHLVMFCFFTLSTIHSFVLQYLWWGGIFLVSNIVYNVYPILLQQYIRIRLMAGKNR